MLGDSIKMKPSIIISVVFLIILSSSSVLRADQYYQDVTYDHRGKPLLINFLTEKQTRKRSNFYRAYYNQENQLQIDKLGRWKKKSFSLIFNSDNRLIRKIMYRSNQSISYFIEYIYNKENLMVYWKKKDQQQRLLYYSKYYYDGKENLRKSELYGSDGKMIRSVSYRYSSEGQPLSPIIDKDVEGKYPEEAKIKRVNSISPKPVQKKAAVKSGNKSNFLSRRFLTKEKAKYSFQPGKGKKLAKADKVQYFKKIKFTYSSSKAPEFFQPLMKSDAKGRKYYQVYFDDLSKVIGIRQYSRKDSKIKDINYYYDASNRLVRVVYRKNKKKVYRVQKIKYDPDGRLVAVLVKEKKKAYLLTFYYNDSNDLSRKEKTRFIDTAGGELKTILEERFYYINKHQLGKKESYKSSKYQKIIYYYDRGKLNKMEYYSKSTGDLLFYYEVSYQDGKKIKTKYDSSGNKK